MNDIYYVFSLIDHTKQDFKNLETFAENLSHCSTIISSIIDKKHVIYRNELNSTIKEWISSLDKRITFELVSKNFKYLDDQNKNISVHVSGSTEDINDDLYSIDKNVTIDKNSKIKFNSVKYQGYPRSKALSQFDLTIPSSKNTESKSLPKKIDTPLHTKDDLDVDCEIQHTTSFSQKDIKVKDSKIEKEKDGSIKKKILNKISRISLKINDTRKTAKNN